MKENEAFAVFHVVIGLTPETAKRVDEVDPKDDYEELSMHLEASHVEDHIRSTVERGLPEWFKLMYIKTELPAGVDEVEWPEDWPKRE